MSHILGCFVITWVLHGDRYIFQGSAKLDLKVGQKFLPKDTIASQKIINNYPGIVNFDNYLNNQEVNIINSSMIVENGEVITSSSSFDVFELITPKSKKLFQLNVKQNELLKHGQTIACLKENIYKDDMINFEKK